MIEVKIKLLSEDAVFPTKATAGSAGHDLRCIESFNLPSRERKKIHTGISIEIPAEHYGRIAPKSGLALKDGIQILGGVIDSDYRGEIMVILYNSSEINRFFEKHDMIAQIIIERINTSNFVLDDQLGMTQRGEGGFGSTGK